MPFSYLRLLKFTLFSGLAGFLIWGSYASASDLSKIDQFLCSVEGYTPSTFSLNRQSETGDFEFKMTDLTRKIQGDLPNVDCLVHENSDVPGIFTCHNTTPGEVSIELILKDELRVYRYDQFKLDVRYRKQTFSFDYHQRVIDMEFSGGDFNVPYHIQLVVNVNFYEGNEKVSTVFRETCQVNGTVIKK